MATLLWRWYRPQADSELERNGNKDTSHDVAMDERLMALGCGTGK